MVLKQFEPKKIYIRVEAQPITTSWIYHNSDLWLISLSSDGSNWITIADKNLGATQVYNDGDVLSEANCGKYYQWGNNYWFPYTWATSIQWAQINASTYWPNNYYSNFVWVNYTWSWDSSDNQDLRWETTNTLVARRWPCDEGYHIMSESEMVAFISAYKAITWDNNFANAWDNLMLPLSYRTIANVLDTTEWDYWCSTPYNSYWRCLTFTWAYSVWNNIRYKSYWHHIRPFKNDAVQPDDSRTKLY